MKLDLNRHDICDLMLACTMVGHGADNKWTALHDRIAEQLKALDEKAERSARKGYKED